MLPHGRAGRKKSTSLSIFYLGVFAVQKLHPKAAETTASMRSKASRITSERPEGALYPPHMEGYQ